MQLSELMAPSIIESLEYERIVERKTNRVQELMTQKGLEWIPTPMDDLTIMIEADAYDELLLIAKQNEVIRQQLLAFATGTNLDHIAASRFGTTRLRGSKPYATFTITALQSYDFDIVVPANMLIGDGHGAIARVIDSVTILAGEQSAQFRAELDEYIESSSATTLEILTTILPYELQITQDEPFAHGASIESDDRFRVRTWEGRERKSTAGSTLTYVYYSKTADARIDKVYVDDREAGTPKIYLLSLSHTVDSIMISRVEEILTKQKIRPLTDHVLVYPASIVTRTITATIIIYDVSLQLETDTQIKSAFDKETMQFGKSLTVPKIYDLLGGKNVADADLDNPAPITLLPHQVAKVTLALHYEVKS